MSSALSNLSVLALRDREASLQSKLQEFEHEQSGLRKKLKEARQELFASSIEFLINLGVFIFGMLTALYTNYWSLLISIWGGYQIIKEGYNCAKKTGSVVQLLIDSKKHKDKIETTTQDIQDLKKEVTRRILRSR